MPLRPAFAVAAIVLLIAGCGGSSGSKPPAGFVHPVGAYVASECSGAAEKPGPQYVVVTSWLKGKLTGNTGRFTGVPSCGDVLVYLDADKVDEMRIPELGIAAKVAPGKTAKLEFYAPAGTYAVRLRRSTVDVVSIVVG